MKYIVEIAKEYEDSFKGLMILGAKDSNLFVDTLAVEDLEELNADYINEHFSDLQDTAYKKGLEDGKAIHEKGCEGCKFEGTEIYHRPCCACRNVYPNQWTAKDDKIEVGDEVRHKEYKNRFVVTKMQNGYIYGISKDGSWNNFRNDGSIVKTGRHFDIQSILEAMKHD